MRTRNFRIATGLALAGAALITAVAPAAAQSRESDTSVVGVWDLVLESDRSPGEWHITLEQDGEVLSGFAEVGGLVAPLEGRVDGEEIMFSVTVPEHDAPLLFVGVVDGASASGVMDPTGGMHSEAAMDWIAEKRNS